MRFINTIDLICAVYAAHATEFEAHSVFRTEMLLSELVREVCALTLVFLDEYLSHSVVDLK